MTGLPGRNAISSQKPIQPLHPCWVFPNASLSSVPTIPLPVPSKIIALILYRLLIHGEGVRVDDVIRFDEYSCAHGGLNRITGAALLPTALDLINKAHKFGA